MGYFIGDHQPGWEVLLYADKLGEAFDRLGSQFDDAAGGAVHGSGQPLDFLASNDLVSALPGAMQEVMSGLSSVFSPARVEAAFGTPGAAGDVSAIEALATGFHRGLRDTLDVSAHLRGATVVPAFGTVQQLASEIAFQTALEMKAYVEQVMRGADQVASFSEEDLASGRSVTIEIPFDPQTDAGLIERFIDELQAAHQRYQ